MTGEGSSSRWMCVQDGGQGWWRSLSLRYAEEDPLSYLLEWRTPVPATQSRASTSVSGGLHSSRVALWIFRCDQHRDSPLTVRKSRRLETNVCIGIRLKLFRIVRFIIVCFLRFSLKVYAHSCPLSLTRVQRIEISLSIYDALEFQWWFLWFFNFISRDMWRDRRVLLV